MEAPTLRFLGWERPAIELVAQALLQMNGTEPEAFRRAVVVVPSAESGRQLREYMAECAGRPLLMPRVTLIGHLIPSDGAAGELETLAAWLQVLGRTEQLRGASPRRMLEVALPLIRVRLQLERDDRLPYFSRDDFERFVASQSQGAAWEDGVGEEVRRWESLRVFFREVDSTLEAWGCRTAEKVRAAALASPPCMPHSRLIVACVPEVSPQHRRYLCRLRQVGVEVEIWVNAPESQRRHVDAFGQPLSEYWSTCPIGIPSALVWKSDGTVDEGQSTIHVEANARAMARKARELAGGCSSRDVALICCDKAFAPSLVTAFAPEWKLNLPEGRSLLATSAAHIPALLAKACRGIQELPLFDDRTQRVAHGDAMPVEAFLGLARNPFIRQCYAGSLCGWEGFSRAVDEIMQKVHPSRVERLLEVLAGAGEEWSEYARRIDALVQGCADPHTYCMSLRSLAGRLAQSFADGGQQMQQVTGCLADTLENVVRLAESRYGACTPAIALELWRHLVEKQAPGALEEMRHDETVLDVAGWRELGYARGRRVIVAAMHDGCVPEAAPQDAYLPEAFRSFMKMPGARDRIARDSFVLTALLQSRKGKEVHFLLARTALDGSPVSPSPLLLRCGQTEAGRRDLAARAGRFFKPSDTVDMPEAYDRLHLIDAPARAPLAPGEMEPISLIAPGVQNRYAQPEEAFSPSRIKEFLHCPLRFWLKLLRGINPSDGFDGDNMEMTPLEYGTVLHEVLRDVVSAFPSLPTGHSVRALEGKILQEARHALKVAMERLYGRNMPLSLYVQQKSMEISLSAFAHCHAADLASGWENRYLEFPVKLCLPAEEQPGIWLDMRLDRVDCHPDSGRWRVIDYKSHDTLPNEDHLANVARDSLFCQCLPGLKPVEYRNADGAVRSYRRWKNVQLPLYAWALSQVEKQGEGLPEAGYCNLPKNKLSNVKYNALHSVSVEGPGFLKEDLESALDWVREVVRLVRSGCCLYSAETLGIDENLGEFGALCPERDPRDMCGLPPLANERDTSCHG